MRLTTVMERADQFSEALADLEPRLGVNWLVYVLEALEDQASEADVRLLLGCLVENVQGRLDGGSW